MLFFKLRLSKAKTSGKGVFEARLNLVLQLARENKNKTIWDLGKGFSLGKQTPMVQKGFRERSQNQSYINDLLHCFLPLLFCCCCCFYFGLHPLFEKPQTDTSRKCKYHLVRNSWSFMSKSAAADTGQSTQQTPCFVLLWTLHVSHGDQQWKEQPLNSIELLV